MRGLILALIFVLVACTPAAQEVVVEEMLDDEEENSVSSWQEYELKDVVTGEKFTFANIEKPVLVKNFAVWCPKCMAQHKEFMNYDGNVISLNVDPNENEEKVKAYVEENEFGWPFVISPSEMTQELIDEFGISVVSTPTTPVILICEDGSSRLLPKGFKPVATLQDEVAKGC